MKQEIESCQRCVVGLMNCQVSPRGPVDAKVVVVSPRPVRSDPVDIVTTQLLEFSDLQLEDCYFTALFMCDTEPLKTQKETCAVWKQVEMSLFYPRLVIMVGDEVVKYFFPDLKLEDVDGSIQKSSLFPKAAFLPIKSLKDEKRELIATKFGVYSTIIKNILRKR